MVYIFLADGFEEIEALCPLDMLRRVGVPVQTVGVTGEYVTGAHEITVKSDITIDKIEMSEELEMIVLPGGKMGTENLDASESLHAVLDYASERGLYIAAICAAPSILGKKGMLYGRSAVCYPGFEPTLEGANISGKPVVIDENIITAKGMGVSLPFALALVGILCGEETAEKLKIAVIG